MHREVSGGRKRHHKDLQLCRQVFDALTYALADIADPLIDDLVLAEVVPAPTAARVLVTLLAPPELDRDAALTRLTHIAGELRVEVAAELSRRRVPELAFRIDASPRTQED
jgi:ribosome-binding factor A